MNNQFNHEHYPDPTVYKALSSMEREANYTKPQPFIYICSPFKGDTKNNIQNARRYSRYAVDKGKIPLAPHLLLPQFMNDANPAERRKAISMGLKMLAFCTELWYFGDRISYGMSLELETARRLKIKIRRFTEECVEVKHA